MDGVVNVYATNMEVVIVSNNNYLTKTVEFGIIPSVQNDCLSLCEGTPCPSHFSNKKQKELIDKNWSTCYNNKVDSEGQQH